MSRLIPIMLIGLFSYPVLAAEQIVRAEVSTPITMSNTDVNRIHCTNGEINDVILSEEKGVVVKIVGSNVFAKFLVKRLDGKDEYVQQSTEFHVVCDGEIYTLIAKPQKGLPATIRLGSDAKRQVQQNMALFKGMSREEAIVKLTLDILRDEEKDSYQVNVLQSRQSVFKEVFYQPRKDVIVDGLGIKATEYIVTPKIDLPVLNEKYFIASEFGEDIEAITLLPQPLKKGTNSRLIIVKGKYE